MARSLARGLRAQGCEVTFLAGSRSDLGGHGDAREFYGEVQAVEFDAALASADAARLRGAAGHRADAPLLRGACGRPGPGVRDAGRSRTTSARCSAWSRELARAGAAEADVLHLHHLTPLNEAAARVAPHVPIVGQLHGTELLMLEQIAEGPPAGWDHAARWAERLRGWATAVLAADRRSGGVERASRTARSPARAPDRDAERCRRGSVQARHRWIVASSGSARWCRRRGAGRPGKRRGACATRATTWPSWSRPPSSSTSGGSPRSSGWTG